MRGLVTQLVLQVSRQARADRIWSVVVAYTLWCAIGVPLARGLSLGAGSRAALDAGLGGLWALSCGLGIWLGVRAIGLEYASGRAVVVLSGPVAAHRWVLGRWLGAAAVLTACLGAMTAVWLVVGVVLGLQPSISLAALLLYTWLEGLLLMTLAALLASRVTALVAALSSVGLWVAGHLSHEYARLMQEWEVGWVATGLFAVLPDLDRLDVHGLTVRGTLPAGAEIVSNAAYAGLWIAVFAALLIGSIRTQDAA